MRTVALKDEKSSIRVLKAKNSRMRVAVVRLGTVAGACGVAIPTVPALRSS